MTRIAFAADLHVDQYGSRINPATGLNARLEDYLATVRFVAEEARRRECDALVIAGDICERKHVNSWIAGKIGEALSAGPDRQFLLEGNHDGSIGGESIVTVIGRMAPGWTGIARPSVHVVGPAGIARPGVKIVGHTALCFIPHVDGRWLRTQPGFEDVTPAEVNRVLAEQYLIIARGLAAEATSRMPGAVVIFVLHQGLSGGAMSEQQAAFLGDRSLVIDAAALGAIEPDAIVAGHFHKHQVLSTSPLTLYTGSVERVDFAEEHEDKGFVVIDTAELPAFEFVPTPARRYVTLRGDEVENALDLKWEPLFVDDAIVRAVDVAPHIDAALLREALLQRGAFDVTEIRRAPTAAAAAGGLAETLTAEQALEAYFTEDPERDALVQRGRDILQEVA